jgi:hypothetical protein
MGDPRIDRLLGFTSAIEKMVPAENDKAQADASFHFVLALRAESSWARDDDALHLLTHDQLAEDETGFDRLTEPHVVGDEEVDAGHGSGLWKTFTPGA